MLLDRRSFAAGSAAVLTGCATVGTRPPRLSTCTPLPRVLVDESRVIRTVAGLRPYRRSGFVVRAEVLGDKRLVHNYGHGGAGITLSWGSSKLATELGLPGHGGRGCGDRFGRNGIVHCAAGAGSRLSGHHLRRGTTSRHHVQYSRRPVPSVRLLSRERQ